MIEIAAGVVLGLILARALRLAVRYVWTTQLAVRTLPAADRPIPWWWLAIMDFVATWDQP